MLTQLKPVLPVEVIGRGKGLCFAIIDYGEEHNLLFVTAIDETGEIWTAPSSLVRVRKNWSMGRTFDAQDDHRRSGGGATS
jgi:hypothetical protein